MHPNIVFLHIPKTAGVTVRGTLKQTFGFDAVAPVEVNSHWQAYPAETLAGYRVFAGHLDWKRLDFVPSPKLVFTILREPLERIASFYLYQRRNAQKARPEDLKGQETRGLQLVKELSIDDYFCDMSLPERGFIDGLYDNFYAHYLAGRRFGARRKLISDYGDDDEGRAAVVRLALENARAIDLVGDIADMETFSRRFSEKVGQPVDFTSRRHNVNEGLAPARSRFEALLDLGPSDATVARLQQFSRMDEVIYRTLCPGSPA